MRKHGEVLRLKHTTPLSHADIALSVGISKTTVTDIVKRAQAAGLAWPYPRGIDDIVAESLLYAKTAPRNTARPEPDMDAVDKALNTRKGATLLNLWDEYRESNDDPSRPPYGYTRFCAMYKKHVKKQKAIMQFDGLDDEDDISLRHPGGERCYVDYSGITIEITDKSTGEVKQAQIFVGVLGASHYIYCEATWTQRLSDWIGSHVRMYRFFGGVPRITTPDNLKSAVTKACKYEPDLNPAYHELAVHYNTAVIPARVRRPRDKASVEVAVQIIQRHILDKLHAVTFFTLSEANEAISRLLEDLNNRPMQKKEGSRRERYIELDKPHLQPLPVIEYEYAEWRQATVAPDYCVCVDKHYYSVPFELIGCELDVRLTEHGVEVLHEGKRVTAHKRSKRKYGRTVNPAHRPAHHSELGKWTPERFINWATRAGKDVGEMVTIMLERKYPHPEQSYRSVFALMRLEKAYGAERFNQACKRAVHYDRISAKSVEEMLKKGLDKAPLTTESPERRIIIHKNLRGAGFFK